MNTLKLVEQLNEMISEGRFPENSKLPPERELSRNLQVTRSSLRKALALLEADGKIWRHVGRGTFVGQPSVEESLQLSFFTKTTNPMEVMEMRLVVEPRLAGFAAMRATPAMIAKLYRCVEKSRSPRDTHSYELWDATLHRTIAEAAQNNLLLSVLNIVNAMRQDRLWGQLKELAVTPDKMQTYTDQHLRCIEAIESRNATAAEQLMNEHLESVKNDLLAVSGNKPL
ncbi:MAG: FadR/GntR family transcriptional regulator [Desulfofustis sp.]|jgi:DNA-binding FadR family transcriptional regulator